MITRFLLAVALIIVVATLSVAWMTGVDGSQPSAGPLLSANSDEKLPRRLEGTVEELAFEIGARSMNRHGALRRAAELIEYSLSRNGYEVERQEYTVENKTVSNLVVSLAGTTNPREIILLGASYDTYLLSPGADSNASGVAVLLELAQRLRHASPARTLRFAFFVNGARPWQGTEFQGSQRYAKFIKERGDDLKLALILDGVGYYSNIEASQAFPFPLSAYYPTTGNFVAFFGKPSQKRLVQDVVSRFGASANLPAEGGALPAWFPGLSGVDHQAFLDEGYPALQITDTLRNRWKDAGGTYDTHKNLDYTSMAALTLGLEALALDLARTGIEP